MRDGANVETAVLPMLSKDVDSPLPSLLSPSDPFDVLSVSISTTEDETVQFNGLVNRYGRIWLGRTKRR